MIVRISGEGQYRLNDEAARRLNELDNELVRLVETGDEVGFRARFKTLVEWVRSQGQPVPPDEIAASDVILPPPDVSLDEARSVFRGEGLVPG